MDEWPRVTVIMPVRNEERYLERSLGAVLGQDYPAEKVEVLVVDGRSTDRTREIAAQLGRGRDVRVLDNPRGIVAPGLNLAIREARGDVVVRVDGHSEIASDYVRRAVEYLRGSEIAGVGGVLETVGETPLARVIAAAMSSRFGVGGAAFRVGSDQGAFVDTVAFPAYPRHVLEEAGPFDEELVRDQDDELNYRLRRSGLKLLLAPDLKVRYYSRATVRSLASQYFQYGYFKVRVMQKHPRQMSPRQFAPPALAGAFLVGLLSAPWSTLGLAFLLAITGLYLMALLVGTVTVTDVEPPYRALLPVIFTALHLPYGCGFLVGLVRFAGRWIPGS